MLLQKSLHADSISNPDAFWGKQAKEIVWDKPYVNVLGKENYDPTCPRWFEGGELSACYNAVDRHVAEGNGSRPAIYYDSPYINTKKTITYADLQVEVEALAAVLKTCGVKKGDTVLIYMPMIPEAIYGMLATVRLGAIHSVVFGGFAAQELAKRIEDCKPKVILYGACGFEPNKLIQYRPLMIEALSLCKHKVPHKLVFERAQCPIQIDAKIGEMSWNHAVQKAKNQGSRVAPVPISSNDPLYLLYTSGSTAGGYMVALKWAMSNIHGVKPGDVFFAASDVGWVVGHSYIVYGPFVHGCTTVLYEGKPVMPNVGAEPFWRLVQEYKINGLYTAPTAMRAIKREDPYGHVMKKFNTSSLQNVFLAGERCDPETASHFSSLLRIPIRDNFWQTETGWPIAAPCAFDSLSAATPTVLGSAGLPVPGYEVHALVLDRAEVEGDDTKGKWLEAGYFDLTDAGLIDKDGNIHIMGRTDDVLNIAGHRLSAGGMEEIVASHPFIAECAVIGVADPLKGSVPIGFIVLKKNVPSSSHAAISADLINAMRTKIGPIACFHKVYVVERLPKTRSGKILRKTMRSICDGRNGACLRQLRMGRC
ncbi:AMP-dependent synthetase and ligase [Chytridium lagenaria]|nr:AMP-dependent synthetase and ligase [Chytridium lagenaria]